MRYGDKEADLSELVGKKISSIQGLEEESDEVRIFTECGLEYLFYHDSECCECVYLADFECDVEALVGSEIVSAELSTNRGSVEDDNQSDEYIKTWTWSFYKIETTKGEIWMRWYGGSNGMYSEEVSLILVNGGWANINWQYEID